MALGTNDLQARRRAWLSAALTAAGLLLVPFLVWLILPAPPKISVPQLVAATVEAAPIPSPTPRPARTPAPRPTPTETPPEPTAAPVKGLVIGPDRKPVPRAHVGCTEKDVSAVTELDGTFELPADANGCVAVAHKAGFGGSAKVTLRAGDERNNTLELLGGGRIEGVVVDDKGAPIQKFMIAVERFIGQEGDDEGSMGRARTLEDERGQFVMENLTPGKYVLAVSAEGHPPAKSDTLEVESGRTVKGVRVVVPRGIALSGVVTDAATRKPIEGARVALDAVTSTGVSSTPSVKTDATGAYTLPAVPPKGLFSIRVTMDGYRTRIVSGLESRGAPQMKADVELSLKGEGGGESELGGIGAVLAPMPGAFGVTVAALTPGGPAEKAGLQRGDAVLRIDGTSTESMTVSDCIQRLRGEPGTRVSVTLRRGDQQLDITITRDIVVR